MNTVFILFWAAFSQAFRAVTGKENQEYSRTQFLENFELLRMSTIWLNELEETYKIAFPKQFGLMRHRNLSTVPNHNSALDEDRTCQNVSFRSVKQNIRLFHNYGYDYVLNAAIFEMVENPRARLFELEDHSGDFEDYHFSRTEREGFCSELRHLKRRVKSVFPFGTCVRLFEEWDCRGCYSHIRIQRNCNDISRNDQELDGPDIQWGKLYGGI
ncbi:unnamed protein product [Allacma fusca]|uniref:Uncharacterized protein n=1 Tax=Allacma fusca TaxID=39272 RepID=A0A8J2LIB9_9HEXA|nr:unnamed protein product [Allacma fusca]